MASSISLVNKKVYLIACYDRNDAINKFQTVYLRMKIDFDGRISCNKGRMEIVGDKITILFKTQRQLAIDGTCFFGVVKTPRFNMLANFHTNKLYRMHIETTKGVYGKNDSDGILAMYFREGII